MKITATTKYFIVKTVTKNAIKNEKNVNYFKIVQ